MHWKSFGNDLLHVPGLTREPEIEFMCTFVRQVKSWTEIGCYCGRSFLAAGLELPDGGFLQGIDRRMGMMTRIGQSMLTTYAHLAEVRGDLKIALLRMDSNECAPYAADTEAVFIDGNHEYKWVARDIEIWKRKSKLLLGHDYHKHFPGVWQAVNEARDSDEFTGWEQSGTLWKLEVTCNA